MIAQFFSNRPFRYSLIGLGLSFSLFLSITRFFEPYELQTYDWRCQLRGSRPVSSDIVFIDIWDDTLKNLGAWPFERSYHADLIKILSAYGAKAIGFDILFVEPRDGDERVTEAARESGNVYFAQAFLNPEKGKGHFVAHQILAPLIEDYRKAAKGVGQVNVMADRDGKRRRVYPVVFYEGKPVYQLSFKITMDVLGIDEKQVRLQPGKYIELSRDLRIPLDDEGLFIVNFAGKWEKTYRHYSYYDILAAAIEEAQGRKPRLDLRELKGKICVIGLTSLGSHDTSPVPIQSIYPMVGMYANVVNGILNRDFIRRVGRPQNGIILLFAGLIVIWMAVKLKPSAAFLGTLFFLASFLMIAVYLFLKWGIWVDLFYPIIFMVLCYAAATLLRMMAEVKKREVMENELKIASEIQKSFLPAALPKEQGLDVAVFMKPAKEVGGDLYTFLKMSGGQLGVMVGDVSGKGTPAALFMAKIVSEFKFCAHEKTDPAQVLSSLNRLMASEGTGGLFVTVGYVIFNVQAKSLQLASGGHLPMSWVSQNGESGFIEPDRGMPIGLVEDSEFSNHERGLKSGDCFALYSDGISEARNRRKEEFGTQALQEILLEHRQLSAAGLLEKVVERIHDFVDKAEQHDDMTLIIVKTSG